MSAAQRQAASEEAAQLSGQIGERIEAQRRLLFGASAIVPCIPECILSVRNRRQTFNHS